MMSHRTGAVRIYSSYTATFNTSDLNVPWGLQRWWTSVKQQLHWWLMPAWRTVLSENVTSLVYMYSISKIIKIAKKELRWTIWALTIQSALHVFVLHIFKRGTNFLKTLYFLFCYFSSRCSHETDTVSILNFPEIRHIQDYFRKKSCWFSA